MEIGGLQKMTLLDYPEKVACTVFLPGCNMRCPFCHNSGLVLPEQMEETFSEELLLNFLQRRQGKLDGVCITGGEPTVHRDLPRLIERIRALGFLVKLDTNGSNPGMLRELLDGQQLDYVAMDIKNGPGLYAETSGSTGLLPAVEESVRLLMTGKTDYEFRTTVCRPFHTVESIRQIGQWIQGAKRYFLQNFEDSGHLIGEGITALSVSELEMLASEARKFVPETRIRGI